MNLAQPTQQTQSLPPGINPQIVSLQLALKRKDQEIASLRQALAAEKNEGKWERAFRKLKGLKRTPKDVAIVLRRKWRFPGTKENPNSKVNLDADGRRLLSVQGIADDLDVSDSTVRNAVDLLETIGLLFDVKKHGHPTSKYDRIFFRWNEEIYQHPDRIDTSNLPNTVSRGKRYDSVGVLSLLERCTAQ